MLRRTSFLVALLTLFFALPAFAGTTGVLRGRVVDIRGVGVANATVRASSPCQTEKTTTDASGHFVFVNLAPDTYTVTIARANFLPVQMTGVAVQADQTATVTSMLMWAEKEPLRIKRVNHHDWPSLLQPGIVSDIYAIFFGNYNDASVPARTTSDALRFVPGLTAAPGQPVQHR